MNDIASQPIHWAGPGLTRIPFALYSDAQTASDEQARIFRGEVWNYLCLEAELPDAGSYRTTFAATKTARSMPSRTAAPIAAR